ncbi:hypothetical protein [Geodermatophilus amargosae]|uniref:hypothetical protein n=1 Tax=Geodermatophilus amargosae TaxID=1296565 RepID=UPI0034E02431
MSADNASWVGPTGWITASDRNAYYDGPHHVLNGPGHFSIYVEYAVLTAAGWATYGEFANHRISAGGFTDSGGAASCTI